MKKIQVKSLEIYTFQQSENDYISLTDMARYKNPIEPKDVVKNWMRNYSTIEFLGIWEQINNPHFKGVEFDSFKKDAGANSFTLSPQLWIEKTDAAGIISKSGRYGGGTFAHKDIAFEFASWISAEFKLYLIKEFQRLKIEENERLALGWDAKRMLTKINYKIHKDDPHGWFQWYCRYYLGRRIPGEDERQIRRWRAITRHIAQVKKNCAKGDQTCRPKQRQAILHWAYDSRKF